MQIDRHFEYRQITHPDDTVALAVREIPAVPAIRDVIRRRLEPDAFVRAIGRTAGSRADVRRCLEDVREELRAERDARLGEAVGGAWRATTATGLAGICAGPGTYALIRGAEMIARTPRDAPLSPIAPLLTGSGVVGDAFAAYFFAFAPRLWAGAFTAAGGALDASRDLRRVEAYMRHPGIAPPGAEIA